ncbi:MAG: hypothetical protein R3C09_26020 [Pirellulaceae bacterium]
MQTYSRGLRRRWLMRLPPTTINSAPACAYLAGTLALIRSQAHRAGTP